MPILNWIKMYDKQDLTQLSRTGKICKRADQVFEKLQDELIDTFGANEQFLRIHRKKIELELLLCKQAQTGNDSDQFFIDFIEDEIEELNKYNVKNSDVYESLFWLEKNLGFKIDSKTFTVFEFYKYIKFVTKQLDPS